MNLEFKLQNKNKADFSEPFWREAGSFQNRGIDFGAKRKLSVGSGSNLAELKWQKKAASSWMLCPMQQLCSGISQPLFCDYALLL
jgi:hypothetical protein